MKLLKGFFSDKIVEIVSFKVCDCYQADLLRLSYRDKQGPRLVKLTSIRYGPIHLNVNA